MAATTNLLSLALALAMIGLASCAALYGEREIHANLTTVGASTFQPAAAANYTVVNYTAVVEAEGPASGSAVEEVVQDAVRELQGEIDRLVLGNASSGLAGGNGTLA